MRITAYVVVVAMLFPGAPVWAQQPRLPLPVIGRAGSPDPALDTERAAAAIAGAVLRAADRLQGAPSSKVDDVQWQAVMSAKPGRGIEFTTREGGLPLHGRVAHADATTLVAIRRDTRVRRAVLEALDVVTEQRRWPTVLGGGSVSVDAVEVSSGGILIRGRKVAELSDAAIVIPRDEIGELRLVHQPGRGSSMALILLGIGGAIFVGVAVAMAGVK